MNFQLVSRSEKNLLSFIFASFVYSVTAERETCALLQKGVAAIFGPQTLASLEHIRSITDVVEVPFIDTKWNMHPVDPVLTSDHRNEYTINLHPDVTTLGSAFIDLVIQYNWDVVTILYENNESMMRLKEIFTRTAKILYPNTFRMVVKQLVHTEENGYRDVLREVHKDKSYMIILDCSKDIIEDVLTQAQQIGMVSEDYYYLLTSLDAHTVDLSSFKYGGTNFTAFRMIDTNKMEVKSVIHDIVSKEIAQGRTIDIQDGNLDTTTALIYDAVHLFALALHELNMIQDINIGPLDCTGETSWAHGSSLINYMKLTEFNGLSGLIKFDAHGLRTIFDLDILELQSTGLEPIGTWNIIDSLNMTRIAEVMDFANPINIMANKTFTVVSVEAAPYTMLKEEVR